MLGRRINKGIIGNENSAWSPAVTLNDKLEVDNPVETMLKLTIQYCQKDIFQSEISQTTQIQGLQTILESHAPQKSELREGLIIEKW